MKKNAQESNKSSFPTSRRLQNRFKEYLQAKLHWDSRHIEKVHGELMTIKPNRTDIGKKSVVCLNCNKVYIGKTGRSHHTIVGRAGP